MAGPKRAVRRLVRLPDGTVGIRYIDLDTGMEILDLSGYQVLEAGQEGQEPLQNDNPDDEEVEINPPSRGSSGGSEPTTGKSNDSFPNYGSKSKNPAIRSYLDKINSPAAQAPTTAAPSLDDTDGDVKVTPDKEIADAEWADVPEPSEDDRGNVTVADPRDPSKTSVFTGIDQNRFNPGLQQAVEDAAGVPNKTSTPSNQATFALGEGLVDRAGLAPGSTGLFSSSMANLGKPTGLYTKAQQNIDTGMAPNYSGARPEGPAAGMPAARSEVNYSGARPEGPAAGMPAARQSVAKSVIDSTLSGARPEGPAAGMPAAKKAAAAPRGAVFAGITAMDNSLPSPAETASAQRALGISSPSAPAAAAPGPGVGGIGSDAVAGRTSTDLGTQPSSDRYGDFGGISKSTRSTVNPVSGMEMAGEEGLTGMKEGLSGARPEGPAAGMPAAPAADVTYSGARPEGPAAGMPAAKGLASGMPSSMSVPGTARTTQPSELGKNAGLQTGLYGDAPANQSTAQSVISGATATASATKAGPTVGRPTTTTFSDDKGYSTTARTGTAGWRNNNPGNLEASSWTQNQEGYIGAAGGVPAPGWSRALDGTMSRMAVFDSVENGIKAQANLLGTPAYQGLTISQAIARYAPAFENNPTAYANAVANALGVDVGTKMSQLSPSQRVSMIGAMHEVEGSMAAGTSTTSLTSKGIAARDHYTGIGTGADTPSERNAASRPSSGMGLSGISGSSGSSGGSYGGGGHVGGVANSGMSGASRSTAGKTSGSRSSGGGGAGGSYGGGSSSYGGGSAGKAASGGVSGASRSTAGKGGASPSAGSGGISGASRSTSGKTSGSSSKSNPGTSGGMGKGSGTTSGKGMGIGSA